MNEFPPHVYPIASPYIHTDTLREKEEEEEVTRCILLRGFGDIMKDSILRHSSEVSVMLDDIMQEVKEEEQLQEDIEWQQEAAVSENIVADPTRKHFSFVLE